MFTSECLPNYVHVSLKKRNTALCLKSSKILSHESSIAHNLSSCSVIIIFFFLSAASTIHQSKFVSVAYISFYFTFLIHSPAGNYMFKVNNRNTRTRCEICSKLTIKTPQRRHMRHSGVFIVSFEHISHLSLAHILFYRIPCSRVSIVNIEQVNGGWEPTKSKAVTTKLCL